ncbi:hypothetical protein FB567DRAFT_629621 [Paraphoma chrysanthemicola]|uniref:DUF7730 domain-containing protein n=1 Tax=Paraphoma chrysanthemicola TaxID=798071 RepID=A0A8K0VXY4_9PLEO|nr:hypothetical protein FB567DRAFT_629621 [Paraphoma chrysanthemicola]
MLPPDLRKPPPPPIRKGASQPEDPNEPSFLTTLPPEVRNAIYEFAFLREEPIVIVDAEEYERRPAWDCDDYEDEIISDEKWSDLQPYGEQVFEASFVNNSTSFLRTCRQSYHEACDIFYGKNMFNVSVALHRHNPGLRQLRTAIRWLLGIGSQIDLVTQINIDVRPVCPDQCDEKPWDFHVSSFVKFLWSRSHLARRIAFTESQNALDIRLNFHPYVDPSLTLTQPVSRSATSFNNFFESLILKDGLKLRSCSKFDRLIGRITIDQHLREGLVHFPSTDRPHSDQWFGTMSGDLTMPFAVTEDGRGLGWTGFWLSGSRLKDIRGPILSTIIGYLVSTQDGIVFDLDARKVRGLDLSMCGINKALRSKIMAAISKNNSVTLQLSTHLDSTNFNGFSALQQWELEPVRGIYPRDRANLPPLRFLPIICLHFDLIGEPRAMKTLRINITEFLRRTYKMLPSTWVQILMTCRHNGTENKDSRGCILAALRQNCFLLLSCLIIQHPEKQLKPCPDIWIDGEGYPVEATYPMGSYYGIRSFKFPYSNLYSGQVAALGMQYIGVIENRRDPQSTSNVHPNYALHESDTLMAMWKSLRDRD